MRSMATQQKTGATKKSVTLKGKKPSGRPINMYMHPDNEQQIRRLAAFVNGRGERATDSQIVKTALRLAKPDDAFFEEFKNVLAVDARFKH